jgi:acetyltransferase
MPTRHLDKLYNPQSIAIIGASKRPGTVGFALVENLKDQFKGRLDLVHPTHSMIAGRPVTARIEDLESTPDLALIATPPETIPDVVSLLGAKGCRVAVVVAAGMGRADPALPDALRRAAFAHDVRIVGPSSVGIAVPSIGMNASFAVDMPKPGKLALVSQSGALMGAVIDWALIENIGFSSLIALGEKSDVGFANIIDHLSSDVHTRAILLCIEGISDAQKFMSALRAGARSRPIVALKVGRAHRADAIANEGSGPGKAETDTRGARDAAIFSAALKRAGVLEVDDLEQLFGAAEILGRVRSVAGNRAAVMTNGGGVGVLASERFQSLGGQIARLSSETCATLSEVLPPAAIPANPVDMLGDADATRYTDIATTLLQDKGVDGLVVVHCPTKLADSAAIAEALAGPIQAMAKKVWPPKPLLVVWLGEPQNSAQRMVLEAAGVPTFRTPTAAVEAYAHLLHHDRAQAELMQTPPAMHDDATTDLDAAKGIVGAAVAAGLDDLPEDDMTLLLKACGIAAKAGQPAGRGLSIAVGVEDDPVFGPALFLGLRLGDGPCERPAYALPPLNAVLARELMTRSGLFAAEAAHPSVQSEETGKQQSANVETLLIQLAQLSHDLRDVRHLDADLVFLDNGEVALGPRRITVAEERRVDRHGVNPRFAIRPYPAQWEDEISLKDGRVVSLRPIRPEDERLYREFLSAVDKNDLRLRFFTPNPNLSHDFIARLTQIDYARSMAFVALDADSGQLLGVVRLHIEPEGTRGEYAVMVRSELKGQGLGWQLMQHIIAYGRYDGVETIYGEVLSENTTMLAMCQALGFARVVDTEDNALMHVTLDLSEGEGPGRRTKT